jgi:hypothetical protein
MAGEELFVRDEGGEQWGQDTRSTEPHFELKVSSGCGVGSSVAFRGNSGGGGGGGRHSRADVERGSGESDSGIAA